MRPVPPRAVLSSFLTTRGVWRRVYTMSSLARRYLDLLGERNAAAQLIDEGRRVDQIKAEMAALWREMKPDERESVFRAVLE